MKFLNELIEKIVNEKVKSNTIKFKELDDEMILISSKLRGLNRDIFQTKEDLTILIDGLKRDVKHLQVKDLENKEELEIGLEGIIKVFNEKFESLGTKKSIVTDLLKKIAKLEDRNVLT